MNLLAEYVEKPSRLEMVKGVDYHNQYARWCLHHGEGMKRIEHLNNIRVNKNFVSPNKQWMEDEDVSTFLTDTSGQTTNRIKVEMNYIQILNNQFVGNVCRMGVNASAQSFSPMVKERREEKLEEMLLWTNVAEMATPEMQQMIQANMPIGNSERETAMMFNNYYVDKYVKGINSLLRYTGKINNINLLKREIAESLSLTGMCVIKPEPVSGEYRWRWVQTEDFIFDREARKFDLSDAAYMGEASDILMSELIEKAHGDMEIIGMIEANRINATKTAMQKPDRLKVYKMYWRDVYECEWGYVKNEFDDIVFEKINYTDEYIETAKYKTADVVNVSEIEEYQRRLVKKKSGKAIIKIYTDQWRYCEFVPAELITGSSKRIKGTRDVILSHGVMEYQEPNTYSPFNMETPYKVGMYMYLDGFVYSPIDIAINPQRITNRLMSVVENIMNNAQGSNVILSKEALDKSNTTEAQVKIKMKRSEPIVISGMPMGGIQNSVGTYDGGLSAGSRGYLDIANMFLTSIEKITGVNEAMKGQMESPDQLVGTMKLMIQKGTVVTERYYTALREAFRQCFQATAESGKRFYINEKPKLINVIGDAEYELIELTKDYTMEHFRVSVDLAIDEETERQYVDGMLFQLLSGQLIDRTRFANLIGRGNTDDMWEGVRDYAKEMAEAERRMAEQQTMEQQQMQQQEQQNLDRAFQSQESDRDTKITEALIKSSGGGQNIPM